MVNLCRSMDLIYTVSRRVGNNTQAHFEWPQENGAICSISSRNTVAFTAATKMNDVVGKTWKCHVYVADLNMPWDASIILSHDEIITCLEWDVSGSKLLIADANGEIQMWTMKDYLLNDWTCVASSSFPGEHLLCAAWFHQGRKTTVNSEKKDNLLYSEKFSSVRFSPSISYFGGRPREGCLAVSITGMVCVIILQSDGSFISNIESLGSLRSRLKVVDLCYGKNGDFLVAATDGLVSSAIQCYQVTLRLQQDKCVITSQPLPGFYPNCYTNGHATASGEGYVRVTHLRFVLREAADAVVVCATGLNESVIELWELCEKHVLLHKRFLNPNIDSKLKTVCWQHHAQHQAPSAIVALTTPRTSIFDGNPPPSYILAAYRDSGIKCFYRESLQLVCSITINPNLQYRDDAGVKQTGATMISDMQLTWSGSALIAIDSLSQLYLYRLSPITDLGDPVSANYAVTLLEYCLITGVDWWDILLGLRPGMIESVCDKMTDIFNRQPPPRQQFLLNRFLAVKMTMYRCLNSGQSRAGDCYASLMLNAVANSFKTVLRPTDLSSLDKGPAENLTAIMTSKQHAETTDVDKVILNFEKEKDFCVESATLQSLQPLIQWVANFTLYLLASLPQQYHSLRYPGGGLLGDIKALSTLRELLVVIRFWGLIRSSCLPYFAKTSETLDVVALLFRLLTRTLICHGNEPDENLIDDCCLLTSQVLVPQLNLATDGLGVASPALSMTSLPLSFEYECEPEFLKYVHDPITLEGTIPTLQKYDIVRHIFMGASPPTYKQCTRCASVSMVKGSPKSAATRAWDQRWARACPCGGQWKLVKSNT